MLLYPLFILLFLNLPVNASDVYESSSNTYDEYSGNSDSGGRATNQTIQSQKTQIETDIKNYEILIGRFNFLKGFIIIGGNALDWITKIPSLDSSSKTVISLSSDGCYTLLLIFQGIEWYLGSQKNKLETSLRDLSGV